MHAFTRNNDASGQHAAQSFCIAGACDCACTAKGGRLPSIHWMIFIFRLSCRLAHLPELLVRHGLPRLVARIQQHAQQVRAARCARRQRRPPLLRPTTPSRPLARKHAHMMN